MAQKITVELQDDLDGGPADETVRFRVDSAEYEIDLSKKNAAAFRKKLAPFIDPCPQGRAGTAPPTGADREPGPQRRYPGVGENQGIAVSARGRIPAGVVEQYHAATKER
jgi:hypothetical protein